ncbi:MAG: glycosyl hydrolase [Lentisphaerota bacterium]
MSYMKLQDCLNDRHGSYILPFLWYAGEDRETVGREIEAIKAAGINEFLVENRGGDWFCSDFWWDIFGFMLEKAKSLDMRVWLLDDSHVPTGSANDSLHKEENARYRPRNLRIEPVDVVGPLPASALIVPKHTEKEQIISVSAFLRDEETGHCVGDPIDLTRSITDDLCLIDLPEGVWRIYFVMTADPALLGLFANYISMLSRDSCRHLIDEVHEKIYAHFAPYFGNTFAGFFSDEPAFGNCNGKYGHDFHLHLMGEMQRVYPWWDDMPERLAARANLSIEATMRLLPALWDDVDSVSPGLRVAYMDVITGLWRDNFSKQIGQWCENHGVLYIGHNLEDEGIHMHTGWGCGHYFRSMAGQHMAGIDIVLNQMVPGITTIKHTSNSASKQFDSAFYQYSLAKLGASLAHITPHMRNRVVCEVFGAYGWTTGLPIMRSIINHFLANGTNHFVPHAYSMVFPDVYMPPSFYAGGLNPQYKLFGNMMLYVQRVCHLLADGVHKADLAVYYNAEPDWENCEHRCLDDVTAALTRSGFDFDILPSDTIYHDSIVKDGRLLVNKESYGAFVLPMAELLPKALLARLDELAAQGLQVIFTDKLPAGCERKDEDISGLIARFAAVSMKELPAAVEVACGRRLRVEPWSPSLRFYGLEKNDGTDLYIFNNEGREVIDTFVMPPRNGGCVIYDPWKNLAYRAAVGKNGMRLRLEAQQLLVVSFGCENNELDDFVYDLPQMRVLPLRYDIFVREAGNNGDFRLLRADSEAVNLTVANGLTRYCGEFRYDATWECSDPSATLLEIPNAGDSAELWINGVYCGASLGPVCRFDISGKLKNCKNYLSILTADNPSYSDRNPQRPGDIYSTKLPVVKHGFVGEILIG